MLRLATTLALLLGLSGCNGMLRFSAPGIGLRVSAPTYAQFRAQAGPAAPEEAVAQLDATGWRFVVAADGLRYLVTPEMHFVTDAEGRRVGLGEEGSLFAVNAVGVRVGIEATEVLIALGHSSGSGVAPQQRGEVFADGDLDTNDEQISGADLIGASASSAPSSWDAESQTNGGIAPGALGAESGAVDASVNVDVNVDVNVSVDVGVALQGTPGGEAERVDTSAGVRAIGRGAAHLGGLIGIGADLAVDGFRVRLGDLGPIAHLAMEADARAGGHLVADASVSIDAELEHRQLPRAGGETHLVVRLRGGQAPAETRGAMRLHLVIDRSSSMQSTWPEVMAAAELLVGELSAEDTIQIVAYGTDAQEILPPSRVGNGRAARRALTEISVGGGTNIESGLEVAYAAAARAQLRGNERNLVILLSDGVPNGGAFSAEELAPMAQGARERAACTTTVIGLGNQFDPGVLRAISTAGQGGYHVARGTSELGPMLRAELHAQMRIAVRDVGVTVNLPAGVTLMGTDEESGVIRVAGGVKLELPQLRAGEERRLVLRLSVASGVGQQSIAAVRAQYRPSNGAAQVASKDLVIDYGARAELAGTGAALAVVDKDLGRAIDLAADAVLNGRAAEATAALNAHVAMVEARADFGANVALQNRTLAVGRAAQVIGRLTGGASHTERREVSIAMGTLAARLMR